MQKDKIILYILLIVRISLGVLFIISSLSKILDIRRFAFIVQNFHLLPNGLVPYFATLLPPFEYILGVSLIFGFYPRFVGMGSAFLYTVFIIAITWNLLRHNTSHCGCFDMVLKSRISVGLLINDFVLLMGSIALFISRKHMLSLSGYLGKKTKFSSKCYFQKCRYFYGILSIFCFVFFLILVPIIPDLPSTDEIARYKNFIVNISSDFQKQESRHLPIQFGDKFPNTVLQDINGDYLSPENLKGLVKIFLVFSPLNLASIDASLAYADTLLGTYKTEPVQVFLIYRFPGKVDKKTWLKIITTIRKKSKVPVLFDKSHRLSKSFHIPCMVCPYVIVFDKTNICRLSLNSPPDYLIHEVTRRYIKVGGHS